MNRVKRWMALLLAAVLCLSLLPVGAMASEEVGMEEIVEEPQKINGTSEIEVLPGEPFENTLDETDNAGSVDVTGRLEDSESETTYNSDPDTTEVLPENAQEGLDNELQNPVCEEIMGLDGVSGVTTPSTVSLDVVNSRIEKLIRYFKGTYFTVNQKACGYDRSGEECSNCYNQSIINSSWLRNKVDLYPSTSNFNNQLTMPDFWATGYSCHGFATFAAWYIFAQKSTDAITLKKVSNASGTFNKSTMSNAQPGDYLRCNGHSAIVVSVGSTSVKVLDCNSRGTDVGTYYNCEVHVHEYSYSSGLFAGNSVTTYRASNYNTSSSNYLDQCTYYPSYLSIRTVSSKALNTYPTSTSSDAGIAAGYLRKTLFVIMTILLQNQPQDDPVYQFLDKKRSEGKKYHVYMTAGMTKFLRIYYGKVRDCLKEKGLWDQPQTDEVNTV